MENKIEELPVEVKPLENFLLYITGENIKMLDSPQ